MEKEEFLKLKAKFFKIFANVPLNLREEIIAVVENKSISWLVAYVEIEQNTQIARKILEQLKKMGVL